MTALLNKKRRAQAREKRQNRRDEILAAADHLFVRQPWPAVTLDNIGRRLGVAKGIASLHFPTKEELFLVVLKRRLAEWFEWNENWLTEAPAPLRAEEFATNLALDLAGRAELTRMMALLHNVVEHNVEVMPVQFFTDWLRRRSLALADLIEERCDGFSPGDGAAFLRRLAVVVIGLRQTAAPSGVFAIALSDDALEPFRVDLREELVAMVRQAARFP